MHAEAAVWVLESAEHYQDKIPPRPRVIEFGGLDVNGNVRMVWPTARWYCVDICDGPGVDEVADAQWWRGQGHGEYDVGLCLEVFEHAEEWRNILLNLLTTVRPGGLVIATAACPPRQPHGAYGEVELPLGEYYGNVHPAEVVEVIDAAGLLSEWELSVLFRGDVRLRGILR